MISKQFLITGMIWAIIGGFFSVLFRLQLGYPDQPFPWLEDFLVIGQKAEDSILEFYYALVTMHGTILGIFCINRGIERNLCKLFDPVANRRQGYGIAVSKYAFLLVLLCEHLL